MKQHFLKPVTIYLVCSLLLFLDCVSIESLGQIRGQIKDPYQHLANKDPLKYAIWGADSAVRSRPQSWNILIKPDRSEAVRSNAVAFIEADLERKLIGKNGIVRVYYHIFRCKCDSSLINLAVNPVNGQDNSTSPPGGISPAGGGGDVLAISKNNFIPSEQWEKGKYLKGYPPEPPKGDKLKLNPSSTISEKILAIIDTGIDPDFFTSDLTNLLWKPLAGKLELYNFLGAPYGDLDNKDDHPHHHGSGVAAVALTAMDGGLYPKLMILKALDANKTGTTFTVNCAISYAIQNDADIINASLGYYEYTKAVDSVSYRYLEKCKNKRPKPIYVFTAAGNLTLGNDAVCSTGPSGNELTPTRLFYPGCFSQQLHNVINVTGLSSEKEACRYQNYSDRYVTLGVLNSRNCCAYVVPSPPTGFTGTSFACPAAAGMVMKSYMSGRPDIPTCIADLQQTAPIPFKTIQGHYFLFTKNP